MSDTPSPFLFVAGHPAIDFINTAYAPGGVLVETIGDGRALLDWMVGAGLVEEDEAAALSRRFSRKALDARRSAGGPRSAEGVRRCRLHAVVHGSNESAPTHVLQRHGLRQSSEGRRVPTPGSASHDSVAARSDAELPHEPACEMTLIAEARGHCDLGQVATAADQSLRQCDSSLQDVGVRSQSQLTRECTDQLVAAQTRLVRKLH
jgi:hypothetical protein